MRSAWERRARTPEQMLACGRIALLVALVLLVAGGYPPILIVIVGALAIAFLFGTEGTEVVEVVVSCFWKADRALFLPHAKRPEVRAAAAEAARDPLEQARDRAREGFATGRIPLSRFEEIVGATLEVEDRAARR